MPILKADLDRITAAGCAGAGCDHHDHGQLYLHQRCHPGGRIEVSYLHGSGVLVVACRECHQDIARVHVAEAAPDPLTGR